MCLRVTGVYRSLSCRCVYVLQECTDLTAVDVYMCYRSVQISQVYMCLCVTGVYRSLSCRCVYVLQECTDLSAVDVYMCYRSVQISQL